MNRFLIWIGGATVALSAFLLLIVCARALFLARWDRVIAISPNGQLNVVHRVVSAGAAVGSMHELYLVKHGALPDSGKLVLRAVEVDRLSVEWSSAQRMLIKIDGSGLQILDYRSECRDCLGTSTRVVSHLEARGS